MNIKQVSLTTFVYFVLVALFQFLPWMIIAKIFKNVKYGLYIFPIIANCICPGYVLGVTAGLSPFEPDFYLGGLLCVLPPMYISILFYRWIIARKNKHP